jgi:hypothetical protein
VVRGSWFVALGPGCGGLAPFIDMGFSTGVVVSLGGGFV